jgi:hypothetical protein
MKQKKIPAANTSPTGGWSWVVRDKLYHQITPSNFKIPLEKGLC